ncbi:creatininase family protein [Haloarchaeobius sp. TZWWS8]|uniref:creatininase family protein n=1 Tax=Haloarchaeobius sp. TZWWS8 TaxID=3446121 RepID=UPI003EBD70C5
MQLAAHTTSTFADRLDEAEVALLPVGSVEQHGPALPLGTDFFAAEGVAEAVGERDDTVLLPTLPVGVSEHHRQFHGTLWTEPETFEDYVFDVVQSVASHGVRKAVVVNGHGGNTEALQRAARRLRRAEIAFAAPWSWWSNLGGLEEALFGTSGIGHADELETSMMQHLRGEHVREDRLDEAESGAAPAWGKSVHGAEVGFDTVDFSESGAVGKPTKGSAAAGEQLFERATEELDALVDWLGEQAFDELLPEEHR